jgi:hypothetical protein
MNVRTIAHFAGPVVTFAYAGVMALVITVLDLVAAVPSKSYSEILSALSSTGTNLTAEFIGVGAFGAVGVGLAVTGAILGAKEAVTARGEALWQLGVIALGGPASFLAGFSLGVDAADTFGIDGGAHTPWSGVLYAVSGAALVALLFLAVTRGISKNGRRGVARQTGPAHL